MSVADVMREDSGRVVVLNGNEAIARGALEAGVAFSASYPGSPTVEVPGTLAQVAERFQLIAEWSTNETVALEAAAGASFAGLRAICTVKAQGLDVAADFLMAVGHSGCKGGLVLVVGDDPAAHTSINEIESRFYGRLADVPVLEPATINEAKEMTRWAFELSEQLRSLVLLRSVTRIAHSRGNVTLGPITRLQRRADWGEGERYLCLPFMHPGLHQKLAVAAGLMAGSPFTSYEGPADAADIIITTGPSWTYGREAVKRLGVGDRVGIQKLASSWPLSRELLLPRLCSARRVLFLEEIDSFLEESVKSLAAQEGISPRFFGKASGHVTGPMGPGVGEMNLEVAEQALRLTLEDAPPPRMEPPSFPPPSQKVGEVELAGRDVAFCPGCPHRATFWSLKTALALDGRKGVVMGDIGCYGMGNLPTGYSLIQAVHCMGSSLGVGGALGRLGAMGFNRPVVCLIGDSTFYHSGIPGLINARYNRSNLLCLVLDNGTTAMTGHQPHPGTGRDAVGHEAPVVDIADLCRALEISVTYTDPYEIEQTTRAIYQGLQGGGVRVIILRRECALTAFKAGAGRQAVVDTDRCRGTGCGCDLFCARVFGCPALVKDGDQARVDEVLCVGCGVCTQLCPVEAISLREVG